jgi:hypothetical protein
MSFFKRLLLVLIAAITHWVENNIFDTSFAKYIVLHFLFNIRSSHGSAVEQSKNKIDHVRKNMYHCSWDKLF